ncbi:hypothetical protein SLS60_007003 [Paraconiothyrium brasiliense]|uniref:Uncharacterized protein n=1 Tax=Paraconiothyrium brasiliense TaxID=300254 RepID=A0ABR3R8C5_9PLEO
MATLPSPLDVSPLASPDHGQYGVSRSTTATSASSNRSFASKSEKRAKFQEAMSNGLGIEMKEMSTLNSPDSVYRLKGGLYSPLSPRPPMPRSGTVSTSMSRARTDPMTQRLIERRATQAARWTVHWRTPLMMIASFLVGVALAMGQHLLYSSLHHKVEDDEGKKVKFVLYGRALAYFSKVAFGMCCTLVYRQRIWTYFRSRALTVLSIDQLFLGTEDPSLFLNWEAISLAPRATFIALVIWLIPFATIIFSPGALTFGWYFEVDNTSLKVPTLNFSAESFSDWRVPVTMKDGTTRKSLMFYNTTDALGKQPGFFDYYDQPSTDITRVTLMNAFSLTDTSLNRADARQESCGGSFNCTYTTVFLGPGYKCEEVATSATDNAKLEQLGAPFNTSKLIPDGKNVYFADIEEGDYAKPQDVRITAQGGVPPPEVSLDDLGVFKSEPIIWIGYAVNSTERLAGNSSFRSNWTHRFDQHIFRCIHYETKYTVKWNYTEPFFKTDVSQEFLSPVVNTTFSQNPDGSPNWANPVPSANYISPRNPQQYKKVAAYHTMGQSLRRFLKGSIEMDPPIPGPSYPRVASDIAQTRLVSNSTSLPMKDLPEQLQEFYTNMVLSLFSAPQMLVVDQERVVVNRTRFQSTFIYNPEKLWACYAPVIFVTFGILIIGAWNIMKDGTTFSVGFSRIMVTTRNTTLDDISRGACLGNDPFPLELMHTRLQFGVLNDHTEDYVGVEALPGIGHCTFGVPSEVSPIRRGQPYAGLTKRDGEKITKEKVD